MTISVTFNADNMGDLAEQIRRAATVLSMGEAPDIKPLGELLAEGAPTPNTLTQAPTAPAKPAKAATRKRPEQAAPPPVEPEPEPEPDLDPMPNSGDALPTLEELKQAVTVAVRAAQKNGGPRKILDLLPGFKTKTGLDFVMNSKEEHRQALYELTHEAGIKVGELAAV